MQLPGCIAAWIRINITGISTGLIIILVILTNFRHSNYNHPDGVIEWDVKSYYAWLPAVLIYNDLSLEFRRNNIDKFGDLIWPVETSRGKQAIVTTMGMALLYSPFFGIAHLVASITNYEADGYSRPYRFALTFGALFYLWAGLLFLKRLLRNYFDRYIVAATLVAVTLGTNLFYYSTYEAAMSHVYNFALIAGFIWLTKKFYENNSLKLIFFGGLLGGLITLIRPVNIIVLTVFFLWNISTIGELKERFSFFIRRFHWVIAMFIAFLIVWIPQFIYWYWVSGKVFYFSYGELGGRFFFGNPQIFNILFSFRKGWLVYTPMMILSIAGIFVLLRKERGLVLPVSVFLILNVYILSSWWNWWYGGGFGLRSFIDSYAIMALPLAAFFDLTLRRAGLTRLVSGAVIVLFVFYNLFQTRQYVNNAIHWWWMNREAYLETFLRLHPTERFWELVTIPDHDLAKIGIYREARPEQDDTIRMNDWRRSPETDELTDWLSRKLKEREDWSGILPGIKAEPATDTLLLLRNEARRIIEADDAGYYERKRAIEMIRDEIMNSPDMLEYIRDKAERNNIQFDSMLYLDAVWIYENQR